MSNLKRLISGSWAGSEVVDDDDVDDVDDVDVDEVVSV
jgi:hypothetical protein